jgi:ribonuclease HI
MHNKGKCSVVTSAEFLKHYAESLGLTGRAKELTVSRKGKEKIEEGSWSRITGNEDIGGSSNTRKGWAPPEEDWVKLNTDAGFCENTGGASFGVVVRDSQGQALLSAWGTWSHVTSAEEAEALACLEGIRLMIERIGRPTVVETDCESLVAALAGTMSKWSNWAGLISEIKEASQLLPQRRLVHARREANMVAHELAKLATRSHQGAVITNGVPPGSTV